MKVAMVLSILQEMGLTGKSSDDALAALTVNDMDVNNALDSFFVKIYPGKGRNTIYKKIYV